MLFNESNIEGTNPSKVCVLRCCCLLFFFFFFWCFFVVVVVAFLMFFIYLFRDWNCEFHLRKGLHTWKEVWNMYCLWQSLIVLRCCPVRLTDRQKSNYWLKLTCLQSSGSTPQALITFRRFVTVPCLCGDCVLICHSFLHFLCAENLINEVFRY